MVGLVEDNLLGTAASLTAVYNKTPDRTSFDLGHINPHFLASRGWLQGKYSNKSDGNRGTWLIGVPFYETAARRAFITDGEAASERVLVFRRDALGSSVVDTVERRALRVGIVAAFAPHATTASSVRLWLRGRGRRADSAPATTPLVPRSRCRRRGTAPDG